MNRSFWGGFFIGILVPLLFLKRVADIVRQHTGKALFVEGRENEIALVLLPPEEADRRTQDIVISLAATASGVQAFINSYVSGAPPEPDMHCAEQEILI